VLPNVMLSPNATNLEAESRGAATVTLKLHAAVCCFSSRAVHVTAVVPRPKTEPLACAQVTRTGATPPAALGVSKSTGTGALDSALREAGHAICKGSRLCRAWGKRDLAVAGDPSDACAPPPVNRSVNQPAHTSALRQLRMDVSGDYFSKVVRILSKNVWAILS
jgi:hypothetical protein